MSGVTLRAADTVSPDLVANLLQRAFSDYIVPATFSTPTLLATAARDDILLDQSYVAYTGATPAGVALVAVRPARQGLRTRLAGMGVVPEGRRSGVARTLLEQAMADARARGSRAVTLEVFERNTAARRLYESHGFGVMRRLLGFTLAPPSLHAPGDTGMALHAANAPTLLPLFSLCAAAVAPEALPPWQVEAASLARLGPSAAVYALAMAGSMRPVGYVALTGEGPSARLVGLGVVPAQRRHGLATAAIAAVFARHPDVVELTIGPLVPETSPLVPFFTALGAARAPEAQLELMARA